MKRKFLVLTLCFTIVFSSLNLKKSYAYNLDSKAIPGVVMAIAPEVFSVLVGAAIEAGIEFATEKEKVDYVKGVYLKADSGVFSTSPTTPIKDSLDLEDKIIKNTTVKTVDGVKKIVIGSLVGGIVSSILNIVFKSDSNGNIIYTSGSIPIYPNYVPLQANTNYTFYYDDVCIGSNYSFDSQVKHVLEYNYTSESTNNFKTAIRTLDDVHIGASNIGVFSQGGLTMELNNKGSYSLKYITAPGTRAEFKPYVKFKANSVKGSLNVGNIKENSSYNYDSKPGISDDTIEFKPPFISEDVSENKPFLDPPSFPDFPDLNFNAFDFSPLGNLFDGFKGKFPFSIPFDIYNIIDSLSVDPTPIQFEVPLFGETIDLDLTQFEELANIVRMFVVIGWVFVLFIFTKKIGG